MGGNSFGNGDEFTIDHQNAVIAPSVESFNDNGTTFRFFGGEIVGFNGMIPIKPSNYSAGNYCWYSCAEVATGQAAYVGNLGFTFPLIPSSFEKRGYQSVHAYVGLGYSAIEGMVKYSDGTWTDDTYRDKNGFNANGGLIVAFDPISINVGVNTFTKAVYLGLGFKTK
jgi:hypothetical protein